MQMLPDSKTYIFWGFVILCITGLLIFALHTDKEQIAMELIQTMGLVVGGGIAGYGLAKK